jgi:hypothetical protein
MDRLVAAMKSALGKLTGSGGGGAAQAASSSADEADKPINTFEEAAAFIKACGDRFSNEQKLAAYGLYKQATAGDVSTARPSAFLVAWWR